MYMRTGLSGGKTGEYFYVFVTAPIHPTEQPLETTPGLLCMLSC